MIAWVLVMIHSFNFRKKSVLSRTNCSLYKESKSNKSQSYVNLSFGFVKLKVRNNNSPNLRKKIKNFIKAKQK